jgi:dCMP deaminase
MHAECMERPCLDKYFMDMATLVSSRSTCVRRNVGAIIVKEKHILSTGYNGAPKGTRHCEELGCIREIMHIPSGQMHELCRGVHAEQNAIAQAAYFGVSVNGGTIYTTTFPCSMCAKILINSGIIEVVYGEGYPDDLSAALLAETNVKVRMYPPGPSDQSPKDAYHNTSSIPVINGPKE